MLSKNQIRHISALRMKKFREETGLFIAEGDKLVRELVNSRFTIAGIYALPSWISQNQQWISAANLPVSEVSVTEMERISALTTPGVVLAVVGMGDRATGHTDEILSAPVIPDPWILALDEIRDPGNMGTIIRIADWFGIPEIWCSGNCVEIFNPKVVQATMGSIARVEVRVCDLPGTLRSFSQNSPAPVYGAFLSGTSVYEAALPLHGIVVIGNESRGISPDVEAHVTRRISIPAYGDGSSGRAESLNASVATAILCAEFRRRHEPVS